MKVYIKTIIAVTFIFCLCNSCSDYLDVPVNGAITQNEFYQSDADANSAIAGAYDMLTYDFFSNTWSSPVIAKSILSDVAFAGGPNSADQPGYQELDDMTHTASNEKVAGLWGVNFFGVHRCNLVIDNVANDSPLKTRIIAEAKALRAYFYLDLVAHFGGVPLLTTTNIPAGEYDISRASESEIYAQIEQDLNDAIGALPAKSAQSAADRFRMTSGTAQTLLGKAKLYQGDYGGALAAFESVINSGEYALEADYAKVFIKEGEFGSGSILEAVYADNTGVVGGTAPWGDQRLFDSNVHIQLAGPRGGDGDGFFTDATDIDFITGWGFNVPTGKLANTFDTYGDTYRKNLVIVSQEAWEAAGGTVVDTPHDYEGYLRFKYGTRPSEQGAGDGFLNFGTNWRLLRYADVLLGAAEAAAFSGDEEKAKGYLNQVKTRAQIAETAAEGEALVKEIQDERFMELCFEGYRFVDLVRWGIAADNIDGFQTGKHELLPIPAGELERASSLTQNPGY